MSGSSKLRLSKRLSQVFTCSFVAVSAWALLSGHPALAQVTIIPNTATAGLEETPGGTRRVTNSNTVTVPARAGRPVLELLKTADRASVEPGDAVVYRLAVRNTGNAPAENVQAVDTLPLGARLVENSVRATLQTDTGQTSVTLPAPNVSGRTVVFSYPPPLRAGQVLSIVYSTVFTPDAVRGNGRNVAIAQANQVTSSAASYQVQIRPGILSDCGTIIGRVFVDKNFDGEQQPGEPGVPNAVIFMDDGNRITTDANGLFSLAYVVAGYRTGTLDLASLPGYTLAPNLYRIEANSPSRLVKLAPGSLARMNFAVTPSFKEGQR